MKPQVLQSPILGLIAKDVSSPVDRRRYVRIVITLLLPVTLILALGSYLQSAYPVLWLIEVCLTVFLLVPAFILSGRDDRLGHAESIILLYAMVTTLTLGYLGGNQGSGVLWTFSFPFLALWLKGQTRGLQWSLCWLCAMVLIFKLGGDGPYAFHYADQFAEQVIAALLFYTCIALGLNHSRTQYEEKRHASEQAARPPVALEQLQQTAYQDAITGLPNGLVLPEILTQEIIAAHERGHSLLVINIRLKKMFETTNIIGAEASDKLICSIVGTMIATVGSRGLFARTRRDEFVCIYRQHSQDINATDIIREILAFRLEYKISDYALEVDHTIGIASYPLHATDTENLLKKAAQALLHAQFSHMKLAFYEEKLEQQFLRQHLLCGQLRDALHKAELSLHYQPQIDMLTGSVVGAEALLRWTDALAGEMSPKEFISVAEKSGLIKPLNLWVMRAAFRQWLLWREEGLDISIAINLSVRSICDPELLTDIHRLLDEFAVPPEYVVLELTESAFANTTDIAMETLRSLHSMGFRLSVDDFGSGHLPLSQLKDLAINELKIDHELIHSLCTDMGSYAVVDACIQLAHQLHLRVVAEGVEARQTEQQLQAMGCDMAQGYYFCKPIPADAFSTWMHLRESRMESALSG
ncbi:EAL domain-containing protein [Undibacterium sp. CY18W]|uniref:EAL domain-containing protein n=1 Tax=Undibacterium hunanense TaxID=2762292 RepID=A0ABR6ZYE8_9BURK|nr:GGDEF domain-containing phosphodiesterase [Undibacterium hunanense]MBC3920799.1 EAL domain-containing protein [Undibacterium hunanense]